MLVSWQKYIDVTPAPHKTTQQNVLMYPYLELLGSLNWLKRIKND